MLTETEIELESGELFKCKIFYKATHCLIVLRDSKVYLINRYKIKGPLGYLDEVNEKIKDLPTKSKSDEDC